MAWLEQRGEKFRIAFRFRGEKFRVNLKATEPKEANGCLARLEENLRLVERGRLEVPPGADLGLFLVSDGKLEKPVALVRAVRLCELFRTYQTEFTANAKEVITRAMEDIHMKHISRIIGPQTLLADVSPGIVQKFVNERGRELFNGQTHYETMTIDAIADLPIAQLAADEAHLHLWTTNAFLFEAERVIKAWGFTYKSCLVWIKPQIGNGNYWRVSHEFLLLGVRGNLTFPDRTQQSWLFADRGRHSAKPSLFRKLIEKVSPGPRLELFARSQAEGWTTWGDQIQPDLFDDLPDGPTQGS